MILALKWIIDKLVQAGFVPAAWQERLQTFLSKSKKHKIDSNCCVSRSKKKKEITESSLNKASKMNTASSEGGGVILKVETEEEWYNAVEQAALTNATIIVKFTAKWCQPCHKIQPLYEKLAAEKNAALKFVLVDVDDLDEIAAAYDVAILPTFVAVQPTAAGTTTATVPETYAGSDPKKLKDFCMKISTAAKKEQ